METLTIMLFPRPLHDLLMKPKYVLHVADGGFQIVGIYRPESINGSHVEWSTDTPLLWQGRYMYIEKIMQIVKGHMV